MGVMRVPGTLGATIGPPADMLYAVDPDGVATISPSTCADTNRVEENWVTVVVGTGSEAVQDRPRTPQTTSCMPGLPIVPLTGDTLMSAGETNCSCTQHAII